nr:malate:quinone oxidoreductase [Arthrobacter sp.]
MEWQDSLRGMMPTYGTKLNENPELFDKTLASTAASLQLQTEPA